MEIRMSKNFDKFSQISFKTIKYIQKDFRKRIFLDTLYHKIDA